MLLLQQRTDKLRMVCVCCALYQLQPKLPPVVAIPHVIIMSNTARRCSMHPAGICLFSNCSPEDLTVEGQIDLKMYPQLLEDAEQRCALLRHAVQDYTDAVVHR